MSFVDTVMKSVPVISGVVAVIACGSLVVVAASRASSHSVKYSIRTITPVAEGGDLVVQLRVDLDSALPAAPEVAEADRHPLSGVHVLLRAQAQGVEVLVDVVPEAPDLVRTAARVHALVRREDPVHLRVEELHGGVEIPPVVGLDEIPGLVDVLLRHSRQYRAPAQRRSRWRDPAQVPTGRPAGGHPPRAAATAARGRPSASSLPCLAA